jgi:glucokinase
MKTILASDIGATKTIIALYSGNKLLYKWTLRSRDCPSVYHLLNDFLSGFKGKIHCASFAVAGPVTNNKARLTNLPWIFDARQIAKLLKTNNVVLINDFEAIGYAIPYLRTKDLVKLNNAPALLRKLKAVIGAGTGLGEAIIYPDNSVFLSEGGHCEFSPRTPKEWNLKQFIIKKYGFAEWESVLSGPGLSNIYKFLTGKTKTPEEITADYKKNKQAKRAIDLFISFYARESSNLALKTLPFGGLYIVGNLANQLLPLFRKKSFMQEFIGRGKMQSLLKRIPLFVVTNREIGLLGAKKIALGRR